MSKHNVVEFPVNSSEASKQEATRLAVAGVPFIFNDELAAVDRARREPAACLASVALARTGHHVGRAIALLADAIAELGWLFLKAEADRPPGPCRGHGPDAA